MNWKKGIGFGALIWVIMFAVVSLFMGFNIYDNSWMKVITAVIAGVTAFILAGYIKLKDVKVALMYGIAWAVVGVILDAVITMRFNALIFQSKGLWLGYLLVLLAPLVYVQTKKTGKVPKKPETPEPSPPET